MQNRPIAPWDQCAPSAGIDVQRLTAHLDSINDPAGFLHFSVRLVNAAGGVLFRSGPAGVTPTEELLSRQALSWSASLRQNLADSAQEAIASDRAVCRCLQTAAGVWIVSCPFTTDDDSHGCLSLLIVIGASQPESFLVIAQLLASRLSSRCLTRTGRQLEEDDGREGLLDLLARALSRTGQRKTLLELTASLRSWSRGSQVALGLVDASGKVKVRSLANVTSVDQRTDYARALANAMRECTDRNTLLTWPWKETGPAGSPILQEAATVAKAGQCLAVPLSLGGGKPVGALVLLWQDRNDRTGVARALVRTGPLLAAALTGPLSPPPSQRALAGATGIFGLRRSTLALLIAAVFTFLNLIPVPFRISADCLTQPVSVRVVVSRFDGILKEVTATPGDPVGEGSTLARLDGKETELQLTGLLAERDKAAKMRDQYLAAGETALAQIARLDSLRFEEQINLVREKQQHLTLVSPIAGIVLSGDLKRAEGSPVAKGQALFEVAPLDSMDVELAVPEKHVAFLRTGMEVTVRFAAYPGKSWQGAIEHIAPKSQIRGNANVFLARLGFSNPQALLRPGMRGDAFVSAGWRPLGWLLFRTPWHTLRRLTDQLF